MRKFKELIDSVGISDFINIISAEYCIVYVLLLIHDKNYIDYLRDSSRRDYGILDYGNTIVYEGILDDILLIVGSAIKGLRMLMESRYEVIYQLFKGLYHVRRSVVARFCPVNDIAITIEYAKRQHSKYFMRIYQY